MLSMGGMKKLSKDRLQYFKSRAARYNKPRSGDTQTHMNSTFSFDSPHL